MASMGTFSNKPLYFDGTCYDNLKTRMKVYLALVDHLLVVKTKLEHIASTPIDAQGNTVLNPMTTYTTDEREHLKNEKNS